LASCVVECCKEDLVKLQLAQNRAARLALHFNQRANINTIHASLSWLRDWLHHFFFFMTDIVLKIPNCLHSQLKLISDTHTYSTRHATRGLFTVPKSRTNSRRRTVLYWAIAKTTPHVTTPLPYLT
jgi:hypothetical protein